MLLGTTAHRALMTGYPWHLEGERRERLMRARRDKAVGLGVPL